MPTSGDLYRRWTRNFARLLGKVDSLLQAVCRSGDADAVHDLRVSIRRARLYARVGAKLLPTGAAGQLEDWGRKLNSLLGPLRDCDVAMNWVASKSDPLACLTGLQRIRESRWNAVAPRLEQAVVVGCPRLKPLPGAPRRKLLKRFKRGLARTRSRVLRAGGDIRSLTPTQRHELRRQVRRWRYLRELALPSKEHTKDRRLGLLCQVQDELGELQNIRVAMALLRHVSSKPDLGKWRTAARGERSRLLQEAQRHLKDLRRKAS